MSNLGKRRIFFEPGQQIGYLTVLGEATIDGKSAYKCKCVCGKIFKIQTYMLNKGNRKSCGCKPQKIKQKALDINPGDVFDYCTIIEDTGKKKNGNMRIFLCMCKCGNKCEKSKAQLNNKLVNCGCVSKGQYFNDKFIDCKYGMITITSFDMIHNGSTYYNYKCDCGNVGSGKIQSLQKQHSCGCALFDSFKTGYKEISGQIWKRILRGANDRGLEFNLSLEFAWNLYEKQNRLCALTGQPIKFGNRYKKIETTASLDRIDSAKGYTEDNVQWVHKDINKFKMNMSHEQLFDLCKKICIHNKLMEK